MVRCQQCAALQDVEPCQLCGFSVCLGCQEYSLNDVSACDSCSFSYCDNCASYTLPGYCRDCDDEMSDTEDEDDHLRHALEEFLREESDGQGEEEEEDGESHEEDDGGGGEDDGR
jgi:hypothetical protein